MADGNTDVGARGKGTGAVVLKDPRGTMYAIPGELVVAYAVRDAETLATVTKVWEDTEATCDAEGSDDVRAL